MARAGGSARRAARTHPPSAAGARSCCTCCPRGRSSSPSVEGIAMASAASSASYNFATDLFQRNAARAGKTAYVDDHGTLTYAELAEQSQRMAAALRAAGVRRDERVLLAMQDNNLWPVSFLGCLYAGVVPVAVNTLLTADDYAYMLSHSRAQLVLASPSCLPALREAMAQPHE